MNFDKMKRRKAQDRNEELFKTAPDAQLPQGMKRPKTREEIIAARDLALKQGFPLAARYWESLLASPGEGRRMQRELDDIGRIIQHKGGQL